MTNPLHADFYADNALQATVEVVENVPLAQDTLRVRFVCPEMAQRIVPGQFLMMRIDGCEDPLIGRPLALYDTAPGNSGDPEAIDVVYLVKGKFTRRLARHRAGERVVVWGPLGNGFPPGPPAEHWIFVAGGIGQTPFLALAQEKLGQRQYGAPRRSASVCRKVTLCYGARSADLLAGVEDFERVGIDVRLSTDDGTRGHHGLVSDLLEELLADDEPSLCVACCGPEPMMEAVAGICAAAGVECQVSLETPMACGVGICFSCVARVRDSSGGWDYQRTCVEGPVFDAARIVW